MFNFKKIYSNELIKDCICIYNDKKEKHNSYEGNLVLEVFAMFSSVEIRITAYAENEEELLKEMKKSYEFLCDRFEQKYINE